MIKIFLLSYFQLLLLCLHSRFLNKGQYLGMVVTNVCVAILYTTIFKSLMQGIEDPWTVVSYAAGTTLGGVSGVWLHKYFSKTKD